MGTTSKALELLEFFTRQTPQIGLSDLARLSGVNKATCFRLMTELAASGLAEQDSATKEYRIGPAVLRLAALREATVPIRAAAQDILRILATAAGETAHMSQLVAGRLETLANAYGATSGMQVLLDDTDFLPFHATSSGSAVMAWLSEADLARILAQPLPALLPATLTTPEALLTRCATVRARGWADTHNTFEAGVASLAVPVFRADGQVSGAISVAAPAIRMTEEARTRILPLLIEAARQVTTLNGGQIPPPLAALWRAFA